MNINKANKSKNIRYNVEFAFPHQNKFPKVAHFSMTSAEPLIFEPTEL
jgi:hypothetical protein